ncbi:hypothetical protein LINPERHAP1_LOCUS32173 [Linum perenne]
MALPRSLIWSCIQNSSLSLTFIKDLRIRVAIPPSG